MRKHRFNSRVPKDFAKFGGTPVKEGVFFIVCYEDKNQLAS